MNNEEVLAALQSALPGVAVEVQAAETKDYTLILPAEALVAAMTYLRDRQGYDFLSDLTAVDRPERFEVVYHLFSMTRDAPKLVVKIHLADKVAPVAPSVFCVWDGSNLLEREVFDLMVIRFEGHPDLRRIMMWDGFPGHPLRKDFQNRMMTYKELEPTRPKPPNW